MELCKNKRVYISDITTTLGDYTASLNYIGYDFPRKNWNIHPHSHSNYELHVTTCGSGKLLTAAGEYEIGGRTVYLTGPFVYHSQYADSEPMDEYCIRFTLTRRPKSGVDKSVTALMRSIEEKPFFICGDLKIDDLLRQMLIESETRLAGFKENIECYFRLVLTTIGRKSQDINEPPAKPDRLSQSGISDIKASLDTFFFSGNIASQDEIAQKLHITRRHLSRLMRQCYGMSFADKQNELRCEFAKELLLRSDHSLGVIWQMTGYSSQQYFNKVFKRLTGATPSEFRAGKLPTNSGHDAEREDITNAHTTKRDKPDA